MARALIYLDSGDNPKGWCGQAQQQTASLLQADCAVKYPPRSRAARRSGPLCFSSAPTIPRSTTSTGRSSSNGNGPALRRCCRPSPTDRTARCRSCSTGSGPSAGKSGISSGGTASSMSAVTAGRWRRPSAKPWSESIRRRRVPAIPRPSDGLMLSSTNAVVTYRTFSPDHIVEGALTSTHRGGRGVRDTRDHDAMARRAGRPRRRARLRQDGRVHQSCPNPQ